MATQSPKTFIPISDPALQVFEPTVILPPQGFGTANVTVVEVDQRTTNTYKVTNVQNNPGGTVAEVQFNNGGSFAGDSGFTYDAATDSLQVTGNVTGGTFYGSGAGLTSLNAGNISGTITLASYATVANSVAGGNVSGAVGLATYATTANSVAVANVSGIGNVALLNKDGNSANVLHGDGSWSADITDYSNSNVASFMAAFGSNNVVTTGNVSAGKVIVTETATTVGGGSTVGAASTLTVDPAFGSNDWNDPASAQAVRGRVAGSNLTKTHNYVVGTTGTYNVTGTNASVFPKVGVLGVIGDTTTTADAAVMAFVDGDSGETRAGAAFKVGMINTTGNSGFDYGLDLQFLDTGVPLSTAPFKQADIRLNNGVTIDSAVASTMNVNGNVSATAFSGTGTGLTALTGANVSGEVTFAATANAVAGANVSGFVANANVANTAWSVDAANVSGLGNIAVVNLDGNVANLITGTGTFVAIPTFSLTGDAGNLSNIAGGNVVGTVSTASTAGTVTTNAQGNITSVGTLSALAVTGNVSSGNFTLDTAGILAFGLGSHLTFGDIPVTNRFYVDPTRTDTAQYTANGSQAKPFATIAAALAVANASVLAPNFVILLGSITEDVTLTKGHVFLVGATSSIAAPIVLSGTVTVQAGAGTIDANHFAIQGIQITDGGASNCITFTGTNPQRLFLTEVWTQCGTGATGAGIYADNTGSGSIIIGKAVKVSHGGTGDRYCFNIQHGTASFWGVETSGAVQVGSVHAGAVLTFNDSELDANGDTVLETYDTGMLVVSNSLITNLAADSFGVKLNGTGGTVAIGQTAINVPPSATGQAVWLDPASLGGVLSFGGMSFYPGKNTTVSPTLTMVPISSLVGTIAYPIFAGNITANVLPQTWSMYDNYTAALSFDTTGKTGILKLVTTNNAEGISSSGYVKTVATTIGALPAAATAGAGARSFVTDCDLVSAGNFGAVAAHTSGANATPVFSDGTNWRIG